MVQLNELSKKNPLKLVAFFATSISRLQSCKRLIVRLHASYETDDAMSVFVTRHEITSYANKETRSTEPLDSAAVQMHNAPLLQTEPLRFSCGANAHRSTVANYWCTSKPQVPLLKYEQTKRSRYMSQQKNRKSLLLLLLILPPRPFPPLPPPLPAPNMI
jgi:hypothetical protein